MATRAEHRRATLLRLGDAAIDLFETSGADVTMAQVAERADVSRRTVFRWVEGKEELAFVHPLLWLDVFDEAWAAEADCPPGERMRRSARAIADHVDADPEPPRRAFIVAATNGLLGGFTRVMRLWIERLTELLVAETDDDFQARVVASAVMGMVDAATRAWVVDPTSTYQAALDAGWKHIAPLFDALEGAGGLSPAD